MIKKIFSYIKKTIHDPTFPIKILASKGFFNKLSDEKYLKLMYYIYMHKKLDLKTPKTFSEKLQWLKLHNRNPEYTLMVDKYKVRSYIEKEIGKEYLVPLIGVWKRPEDIDFDALPDKFVLKCNHNSGLGMCICTDKQNLDLNNVRKNLARGLRQNYYYSGREWPYKDVPPRIIAEKYLEGETGHVPTDYKVLCFHGEPKLIQVNRSRFSKNYTVDFYDNNWNISYIKLSAYPQSNITINKPIFSDEMLSLSRKLAQKIPHIRVDWYYTDNRLYFGELTFFSWSGFYKYEDDQDSLLGSWLKLPR